MARLSASYNCGRLIFFFFTEIIQTRVLYMGASYNWVRLICAKYGIHYFRTRSRNNYFGDKILFGSFNCQHRTTTVKRYLTTVIVNAPFFLPACPSSVLPLSLYRVPTIEPVCNGFN